MSNDIFEQIVHSIFNSCRFYWERTFSVFSVKEKSLFEELIEHREMKDNMKQCWICYETEDEGTNVWTRPCKCKGTVKWVHQNCLLRFMYEKIRDGENVECPHCKTVYIVVYSPPGYKDNSLVRYVQNFEWNIVPQTSFIFLSLVVSFVETESSLVPVLNAEPIGGLITINCLELMSEMIPWEYYLLLFFRKMSRVPFLRFLPSHAEDISPIHSNTDKEIVKILISESLSLAVIPSLIGKVFFNETLSVKKLTIISLGFIFAKGFLKMRSKQEIDVRHWKMMEDKRVMESRMFDLKILDYSDENLEVYGIPKHSRSSEYLDIDTIHHYVQLIEASLQTGT